MFMKAFLILASVNIVYSAPLTPEEKQRIDDFINGVLQCKGYPGITVAAVRNGEIVLAEGYGVADIPSGRRFTADTMVNIASVTKQFTALLLSKQLSQSSGLTWNTPVRNMLDEDFHFITGFRTNNTNLRDLLSHKTGIPRHDQAWILDFLDRNELMRSLRFYEPINELRTSYLYTNTMFTLAGKVSESLAGDGRTWEDLIYSEFFLGVGMTSSGFVDEIGDDRSRFATPYMRYNDTQREVEFELVRTFGIVGPAASIASNANDMAKWLNFVLSGIGLDGFRIMNMEDIRVTWKLDSVGQGSPDSSNPILKPRTPVTWSNTGYGKGWGTGFYREYILRSHLGNSLGYYSLLAVLPDMNMGVFLSINYPPDRWHRQYIAMYILDTLMGETPWLNSSYVCNQADDFNSYANDPDLDLPLDIMTFNSPIKYKPSAPLARDLVDYVGEYGHFGYGNIYVALNTTSGNLQIRVGRLGLYELVSSGKDTFNMNNIGKAWYMNLQSCVFSPSGGDSAPIDRLVIARLEYRNPPMFQKGLKMSAAPPPRLDNC